MTRPLAESCKSLDFELMFYPERRWWNAPVWKCRQGVRHYIGCGSENRILPGGDIGLKSGLAVFLVSDEGKAKFYFQSISLSNCHEFRNRTIVFAGVANRGRQLIGKAT